MAKAGCVKTILSANTEAMSIVCLCFCCVYSNHLSLQVESLAFDNFFRAKVTWAQFETACEDLKDRYVQPILDAIANAKLPNVRSPLTSDTYLLTALNHIVSPKRRTFSGSMHAPAAPLADRDSVGANDKVITA